MKYSLIILLFISLSSLFLSSCREESIVTYGPPEIESVLPEQTFIGDTVTVYGKNFGFKSAVNGIFFDSAFSINSNDCAKWTISIIKFVVSPGMSSATFCVMLDSVQSNKMKITVDRLPPYDTVVIPADSFMMGSDKGLLDELPVHKVVLTNSLIMTKFEITQRLFYSVMGYNPSEIVSNDLPVYGVTWYDAVHFCNELSKIEGLDTCYTVNGEDAQWDSTANGWRLPTEAEWEYSCRAGSTGDYSGNGNLDDIGWYSSNSGYRPHPVGSKNPNAFGLFDMHGNVWEWCWDWYDPNYYSVSPVVNPQGPADFWERDVLRGGSYSDGNAFARSSNRTIPAGTIKNVGFRIVRRK